MPFIASALYVALSANTDALPLIGAALLLKFGGNLLFAAWRGRASWLSRIGPLPWRLSRLRGDVSRLD